MHSIRIHKVIEQIISIFYRIGFWHRGDKATVKELRLEVFYCVYQFLFTISLAIGAITNEDPDEYIFLLEVSTIVLVLSVKLKLQGFGNFVVFASILIYFCGVCEVIVIPLLGSENELFFKIAFPLDWRNNDFAFWLTTVFFFTQMFIALTSCFLSVLLCYLMLNCSLRYQVLGSELRKMGQIGQTTKLKISEKAKQNLYFEDLRAAIDAHLDIRKLIRELESFSAILFLLQLGTSALCIGGSIYCLASVKTILMSCDFTIIDFLFSFLGIGYNFFEILVYTATLMFNAADIYSITYFGNEIMLSSGRLSYCLYESDWIEQPHSTKKCIIIFGEYLKQPQTVIVGKLYPLTLETFTTILNSAYSMFNILQNFNELNQ